MSVVGFDLGNVNCYISVARQGGIEVLTNEYSLHATPSYVSFGSKGRQMGVSAKQQQGVNVKNCVNCFKHLLGRKFSDPVTNHFKKYISCDLVQLHGDEIGIKVNYLNDERVLLPEQVTAMLLVKLRDITSSNLSVAVVDCVVTVPYFYTDRQRRALLDAIHMADLNCLKILNETTAVALAYGIYKQDLPIEPNAPRLVVFVDIGHSCAQACVIAFNKGKLTVLGNAFDFEVAGCILDDIIRNRFRDVFKESYQMDVSKNMRAWTRLLDECEKLKKQMSANSTPIPLNIECLMDDKDVSGSMQRSEFEQLAAEVFVRFEKMLLALLSECNMKPNQIDSIEIIGGSSRIPAIKNVISRVFGQEPRTTMNQDEAVARGAAMQCAILSPAVKVRDFQIKDSQPYRIRLEWEPAESAEGGASDVFVERDEFPFSKLLNFTRQKPFVLRAYYPNSIPHSIADIGRWSITNVTPTANNEGRKIKVKVRVNPHGLFAVTSAIAFEAVEVRSEEEQQKNAEPMDIQQEKEQSQEQNATGKDEQKENMDSQKGGDLVENQKKKMKTISQDLPIEQTVRTIQNLDYLRQLELAMQKVDRSEKENADAKNAVEEYVYYMRDKLSGDLVEFINDNDSSIFNECLTDTENWLYDEGEDAKTEVYVSKLEELKKYGDPVMERYNEDQHRSRAFGEFERAIVMARKAYDEYSSGSEKYAHLDSKDIEKVISAVEEKQMWIQQKRNQQDKHDKSQPPIIFVHEINSEKEKFDQIVKPILNKPKPKSKKEKAEPKPDATKGGANAATEANDPNASDNATENEQPAPANMEVD